MLFQYGALQLIHGSHVLNQLENETNTILKHCTTHSVDTGKVHLRLMTALFAKP